MHHLLVTIGSHGDVHPFVGLGTELRRRGHRVTVAANELFAPLISAAGLEFVQMGAAEDARTILQNPDIWHPLRGFKAVFELGILPSLRPTFDIVRKFYVPGQTIVTAHAIAFGARIAQEVLGCPLATIHLSPAVLRSRKNPPVFGSLPFLPWLPGPMVSGTFRLVDWLLTDPVLAGPINTFRAQFGLPPVRRIMHQWWHSPQRAIGLFPEWYAPPQPDWPPQLRLAGFPLYDERGVEPIQEDLRQFLSAGPPPVAFTFGSAMTQAGPQMLASVQACQRLQCRGLLLTRHRQQVPENLPADVLHVAYAPFSELLPQCAALVHHGGIGTTAQALTAGVPQLIMPLAHDQHDNAARIQRLGVGAALGVKHYTAANVANVIDGLLNNAVTADHCREIHEKFLGHDALALACDWIEQLR